MTELSFLIELLLNHDLPKATKDLVASRIKEVEEKLTAGNNLHFNQAGNIRITNGTQPFSHGPQQAPSTLAAMAKHGDLTYDPAPPEMPPVEVTHIAQTPATAAALNKRNEMISAAIAGKGPQKSRNF